MTPTFTVDRSVCTLRVSTEALAALDKLPKWVNQNPFLARVLKVDALLFRISAHNQGPLGPVALGRSAKILKACELIHLLHKELAHVTPS